MPPVCLRGSLALQASSGEAGTGAGAPAAAPAEPGADALPCREWKSSRCWWDPELPGRGRWYSRLLLAAGHFRKSRGSPPRDLGQEAGTREPCALSSSVKWVRSQACPWKPARESRASRAGPFSSLMPSVAAVQRWGGQTRLGTGLMRSLANWHLILASRQHMTVCHLAVLSPSFPERGCVTLAGSGWGWRFPVPVLGGGRVDGLSGSALGETAIGLGQEEEVCGLSLEQTLSPPLCREYVQVPRGLGPWWVLLQGCLPRPLPPPPATRCPPPCQLRSTSRIEFIPNP